MRSDYLDINSKYDGLTAGHTLAFYSLQFYPENSKSSAIVRIFFNSEWDELCQNNSFNMKTVSGGNFNYKLIQNL